MLINSKRCIIFNFFVILWYNYIDTQKRLLLIKGGIILTRIENIFEEWTKRLPDKSRTQLPEVILKAADSFKDLTPEEENIIKEAEDFLLQRD